MTAAAFYLGIAVGVLVATLVGVIRSTFVRHHQPRLPLATTKWSTLRRRWLTGTISVQREQPTRSLTERTANWVQR